MTSALTEDLLARCAEALEMCADDTVVCLTTAARLHGMWLPPSSDDVHVAAAEPGITSRAMIRTRRRELRAHRRQLTDLDCAVINGIGVTSPARTWVDLASVLRVPDLVAAGDSVLRGGTTIAELDDVVRRSSKLRGVRRARAALPMLDGRSRSRPESHLRVAASPPDLPRWDVNVAVHRDQGGWLAEPDLSLAVAKIALEYQGEDHASVDRMRRDITRSADLRREGWACLLYGPAEVFGRPWQIAPEIRRLIRNRVPQLLAPRVRRRVVD